MAPATSAASGAKRRGRCPRPDAIRHGIHLVASRERKSLGAIRDQEFLELADGDRAIASADPQVAAAVTKTTPHRAAIVATLHPQVEPIDADTAVSRMRVELGVECRRQFDNDGAVASQDVPIVGGAAAAAGPYVTLPSPGAGADLVSVRQP